MNPRASRKGHIRTLSVAGAASLIMTSSLVGCGGSSSSGESGSKEADSGTYTIGVNIPLSGAAAPYGKLWTQVINLAVADVNKSNVINGKIKVAYTDSQALAAPGVTGLQKLINVNHAIGVLTGFSNVVKAQAPIANRTKIPIINCPASSPELASLGKYVFSDIPLASAQLPVEVPYLAKEKNYKRWSILYSSEALGEGLLKQLKTMVPANGGKIVGAHSVTPDQTSFQSAVQLIKADNPDIVYFADTAGGGVYPAFLNELAAAGVHTANATYYGVITPDVLKNKNAEGLYSSSNYQNLKLNNSQTKQLVKSYTAKFGANKAPDGLQVNFYNGLLIFAQSIAALQHEKKPVNSTNIRDVMASQKFTLAAVGNLSFTPAGTVQKPLIQMVQVKDGAEVTLTKPVKSSS